MCAIALIGTKLIEPNPAAVVRLVSMAGAPTRRMVSTSALRRSPSSTKRCLNSDRMWTPCATPMATIRVGTLENVMSIVQPMTTMNEATDTEAIVTTTSGPMTPATDRKKKPSISAMKPIIASISPPLSRSITRA